MDADAVALVQMHGQDVPWLLEHWAEQKGSHDALVWSPASGQRERWTYAELWRDVQRVAAGLRDRGVGKGERVIVHSENCPEMLVSWLGCATLGAVAVTTNTKSVPDELAYMITHADAVAAIVQGRFSSILRKAGPQLRWVAVIDDEEGPTDDDGSLPHLAFADLQTEATWVRRPAEPLLPSGVMFTSGTTSRPKAVLHTHANAIWASRSGSRVIGLADDDCYLVYLPLFHVNALYWSFFSVLGVGATCVLMPKWSRSRFWQVVADNGVTHISLMPFVIPELERADRPATRLRMATFGRNLPGLEERTGIRVTTAYGMTETVTHAIAGLPGERGPFHAMGRVNPGYEVLVVDPETKELSGPGDIGELWVRGTRGIQLFLEYYGDPVATAAAFSEGWFKTGDLVWMAEGGTLFFQERDKDVLKVGGENVSAKEIEDRVLSIPGVASVAVVGKAHDFLDQVVCAFVIRTPDAPPEAFLREQIIDTCRERLARFKVPRAVYFVDSFPTGTLDKLLKNKLREMADAQPSVD
jgi:crotonobetaine/carnitine-CoA ligase